jgi:hypothetical protein
LAGIWVATGRPRERVHVDVVAADEAPTAAPRPRKRKVIYPPMLAAPQFELDELLDYIRHTTEPGVEEVEIRAPAPVAPSVRRQLADAARDPRRPDVSADA